jgi:CIC family chloride channel protein
LANPVSRELKQTFYQELLTRLARNVRLRGDTLPLLLAILVGLITGLAAYAFIILLEHTTTIMADLRDTQGVLIGIGVMAIAGIITGTIIDRFAREAKGHGVPEVMEAIALRRGRIRPRVAVAKILASTVTIGAGGSAGREGPIVQVGSTLGSVAGQWFKLSDEQVRMLVASGAAAGIAATFNAPIAGSLFALEVILGRFTNRYLGIVVVSSVSANVVSRLLLGEAPAFRVPIYSLNSPLELPLYIVLGISCGLMAIAFISALYSAEHFFDGLKVPLYLRTAIGMGLTGILAILAPEVLGPGLEFIGDAIANDMSLVGSFLLGLLVLKLLVTTLTLGSGNSGGVFAPSLFMGAVLGGMIGQAGNQFWPNIVIAPGAFALVGMAALFAGAARSPITAIVIVLEMSNDYRLILPLLLTVIISTLLADLLHPDSIYTQKLTLRGIHLNAEQDIDVLQGVTVRDVMQRKYETISPEMVFDELIPRFSLGHYHGFPIVDKSGHLKGIITLTDIERLRHKDNHEKATAIEIGTTSRVFTVFPDDPIHIALRLMNVHNIGRLPVISREDEKTFVGMVQRVDILKAYNIGIARRAAEQHREKRYKLRSMDMHNFIEVTVEPGAPMEGQTLLDFPCSDNCLVIAIHRGDQTFIAHGDTRIKAGDRITAYVLPSEEEEVIHQFTA